MDFYILNRQEELLAIISNEDSENSILYKAVLSEQLDKMYTLEMEVSAVSPESQYIVEENYVLFKDLLGEWQLYTIKEVNEAHGVDHIKSFYCENASQELHDDLCSFDMVGTSASPSTLATNALTGTRFEVGTISNVGTQIVIGASKNKSVLEVLQTVRAEFNLHIRFRYTVVGKVITHRYVDLMTTIGSDYGKRFEYSKDIDKIERIVNTTDLKTAIFPVGGLPENALVAVNIAGIAWATPTKPLNKPLGQSYLEDANATAQWGAGTSTKRPRYLYYENTALVTPTALMDEAYAVLKVMSIPKVTYIMAVTDLYAMSGDSDLSYESVRTGDLAVISDTEFTPTLAIKTSIIERTVDLLVPENTTIVLGNYINSLIDNATQTSLDSLKQRLGEFSITEFSNGSYSEIEKLNDQNFKESVGYTYMKATEGLWVYDSPSDANPTKMIALKGGKLGIGKWNINTQQWQITTFIDGDSVNASAINTGILHADRIESGSVELGKLNANVQTTINSVSGKASTTYVNAQLTIRDDSISAKAEKAYVDAMQIGGANLLANSTGDLGTNNWTGVSTVGVVGGYMSLRRDNISATAEELMSSARFLLRPNQTYTISVYAMADSDLVDADIHLLCRKVDSVNGFDYTPSIRITPPVLSYGFYSFKYTTPADIWDGYIRVDNNKTKTSGVNSAIWVSRIKVEEGDKATGWSPAITDVTTRLDSAEQKITSSAIVATVRSSTAYINDLGTKITATQSSAIAQTASNVKIGFNGIDDNVDISSSGLVVTNGALSVKNGNNLVVIDGNYNMHKILVSGTIIMNLAEGERSKVINISHNLGYSPCNSAYMVSDAGFVSALPLSSYSSDTETLGPLVLLGVTRCWVSSTKMEFYTLRPSGWTPAGSFTLRYYLYKEAAI